MDEQALLAAIQNNPAAVQALQQNRTRPTLAPHMAVNPNARGSFQQDTSAILKQFGIALPDGYTADVDPSGKVSLRQLPLWDRHNNYLVPAILGGGFLGGALAAPTGPTTANLSASAGGAGAQGIPAAASQTMDWTKILGPLLQFAIPAATGSFKTSPQVGIDPGIASQITALLAQQNARSARTTPIHEAAMKLALQLAPTGNNTPRMQSAIDRSAYPSPTAQTDPQVLDAIQRLMR